MTAQELKSSILQMAVQGKLVEQRPKEGTAEELLKRIRAEKEILIKEGKIKKEKPLPEITQDEIPFEIPESWEWVRLGEVVNIVSARRVFQTDWKKEGIPFYRAREIVKLAEEGFVDNELYISKQLYDEYAQLGVPQKGDLMVSAVGTLGKTYIVKKNDRFYYKDASVICLENFAKIIPEYIKLLIESPIMISQIRSNSKGTTVATLTIIRMSQYLIPLPPLAEQKRIVDKIEELLPYIEQYDKVYTKLETLNNKFPIDLRNSFLQFAIQGKLVEQKPVEGTAKDLLEQIRAEKSMLLKEGKIKKDKRLIELPVLEDAIPFNIPENWKWIFLGTILNKLTDGTHRTPKYVSKGVKFVSVKNMSSGKLCMDDTKFITQTEHEELYARCNPEKGDILLSKVGTTGIPAIVDTNESFSLFVSVALLKFSHTYINIMFLYYLLYSPLVQFQAIENTKGIGNKNWVLDSIAKTIIPIPPLAEQKRIVAKLEHLLQYCEQLKKCL